MTLPGIVTDQRMSCEGSIFGTHIEVLLKDQAYILHLLLRHSHASLEHCMNMPA